MVTDIYDPLNEYVNVFHGRFKDVAEATFAELADEAKVDVNANQETCRQIYSYESELASGKSSYEKWNALNIILWFVVLGGIAAGFILYHTRDLTEEIILAIVLVEAFCLSLLFLKVRPRMKALREENEELTDAIQELKNEAWQQMAPLNHLYDWDILTRMMSETVPRLQFDPYFTTKRLADLQQTYGWNSSFNDSRSVIYSHSGLINGNPFVICRTRTMEMGSRTYYGHKTIHWTTRERGADGKYHTVHHSETLTASVTAPYPEYFEKTRLIYGNTAAPDLIFYRVPNNLAGKENSFSYKRKRRSLRKKARDLSNADFAMMTNEEFEVAFDASNRNNNQQFALLFTPLAQESMLRILSDETVGYGDDFSFEKTQMINVITPSHIQTLDLDLNPEQYHHFDFDEAKKAFYDINAQYFRAIYFSFAPLLCVPMYQQIRPLSDIYGREMPSHSSFWEHEAIANHWGQDKFMHPSCVTDCILKTKQKHSKGNDSTITVYAHGYRAERHVEYIQRYGGDGRWHNVPVEWYEYLPVTGTGAISLHEDNDFDDSNISPRQRKDHISSLLDKAQYQSYRRHIASKLTH